jgi:arginyl-tRNA--protein-N-Asp/Glu arginylyltransferase
LAILSDNDAVAWHVDEVEHVALGDFAGKALTEEFDLFANGFRLAARCILEPCCSDSTSFSSVTKPRSHFQPNRHRRVSGNNGDWVAAGLGEVETGDVHLDQVLLAGLPIRLSVSRSSPAWSVLGNSAHVAFDESSETPANRYAGGDQ